jgi:hypothetical protein
VSAISLAKFGAVGACCTDFGFTENLLGSGTQCERMAVPYNDVYYGSQDKNGGKIGNITHLHQTLQ